MRHWRRQCTGEDFFYFPWTDIVCVFPVINAPCPLLLLCAERCSVHCIPHATNMYVAHAQPITATPSSNDSTVVQMVFCVVVDSCVARATAAVPHTHTSAPSRIGKKKKRQQQQPRGWRVHPDRNIDPLQTSQHRLTTSMPSSMTCCWVPRDDVLCCCCCAYLVGLLCSATDTCVRLVSHDDMAAVL